VDTAAAWGICTKKLSAISRQLSGKSKALPKGGAFLCFAGNVGRYNGRNEVLMPQMTPQVSEVLEEALTLSTQERGLIIGRLIDSLDEGSAEDGVEEARADEIKSRVDAIRSGKVEMIPGEQVLRDIAREFPDEK
jgi:putative addiction module component (TIGR02574 family)